MDEHMDDDTACGWFQCTGGARAIYEYRLGTPCNVGTHPHLAATLRTLGTGAHPFAAI